MSGVFENYFDSCRVNNTGTPAKITCQNFMGQIDTNYLHENKLALCEYHYCAIIKTKPNGNHDTLSCSGAIMRFGDNDYFYNPITPLKVDFSKMKPMPSSSVGLFSTSIDFYYAKDVRTRFDRNILSVNCTNSFKTCLVFEDKTLCLGNVHNQHFVTSQQALTWGAVVSLFIGAFVVFCVMPIMYKRPSWQVFVMMLLPVGASILLFSGIALGAVFPFVVGNFLVLWTFPVVYYSMRDVYRKSGEYMAIRTKTYSF